MGDFQSILTRVSIRTVFYVLVPAAIVGTRVAWRFFKQVNSEDCLLFRENAPSQV